ILWSEDDLLQGKDHFLLTTGAIRIPTGCFTVAGIRQHLPTITQFSFAAGGDDDFIWSRTDGIQGHLLSRFDVNTTANLDQLVHHGGEHVEIDLHIIIYRNAKELRNRFHGETRSATRQL